eukprot:3895424-Heterocapsa_arctica.AAC.1
MSSNCHRNSAFRARRYELRLVDQLAIALPSSTPRSGFVGRAVLVVAQLALHALQEDPQVLLSRARRWHHRSASSAVHHVVVVLALTQRF